MLTDDCLSLIAGGMLSDHEMACILSAFEDAGVKIRVALRDLLIPINGRPQIPRGKTSMKENNENVW